jgi:hypothetical protein
MAEDSADTPQRWTAKRATMSMSAARKAGFS